jgi:hypothetical protein
MTIDESRPFEYWTWVNPGWAKLVGIALGIATGVAVGLAVHYTTADSAFPGLFYFVVPSIPGLFIGSCLGIGLVHYEAGRDGLRITEARGWILAFLAPNRETFLRWEEITDVAISETWHGKKQRRQLVPVATIKDSSGRSWSFVSAMAKADSSDVDLFELFVAVLQQRIRK